jgi:Fic family protein
MERGASGRFIRTVASGGSVDAFVPATLPPHPSLDLAGEMGALLEQAYLAVGRLDGVTALMADPQLLLYAYVRSEAVLSSQIEGTQSSLSDLMLFEIDEAPGVPLEDVQQVSDYVAALESAVAAIQGGDPISNRLLREIHARLLSRGRGSNSAPGEFRRVQNWVGGSEPSNASFVPPPPLHVEDCMGDLERFLNDQPARTSALVKAALAHVQFETIHPFLDGNGRVGRMLVPMVMCREGVLEQPLLYLSLYLKRNRMRYYELLNRVRYQGDWEAWLEFFLQGVIETARSAVATARALAELAEADRVRVQGLGRISGSALQVHQALLARPLDNIARLSERTGLTVPTVTKSLQALVTMGLVRETSGRRRGRVFAYTAYMDLLQQGSAFNLEERPR